MLRLGLTGGIGCGKTTVAAMLRELGCHVIEADRVAHQLMQPGTPAFDEIVHEFGARVVGADGRIDRKTLGTIVFEDSAKLQRLNRIVHPRVIEEQDRQLVELERADRGGVAVVEAALLIEASYHERLDRLVVVWCRPEQQRERLRARGMPAEEIEKRIAAQMPLEMKRRLADDQIDCSGSLDETRRQVEALVARLRELASKGKGARQPDLRA